MYTVSTLYAGAAFFIISNISQVFLFCIGLILPECVLVRPQVHSESRFHYRATPVKLQRCSYPVVWKCTCWRFGPFRNLTVCIIFLLDIESHTATMWRNHKNSCLRLYYSFCSYLKNYLLSHIIKSFQNKANYNSTNEDPPQVGSDSVILSTPCSCVVDGFPVDL